LWGWPGYTPGEAHDAHPRGGEDNVARFRVSQATDNRNGKTVWAVYDASEETRPILSVKGSKEDAEEDARCLNMAGVVIC